MGLHRRSLVLGMDAPPRRLLPVGAVELVRKAGNAFLDLFHAALRLRAAIVFTEIGNRFVIRDQAARTLNETLQKIPADTHGGIRSDIAFSHSLDRNGL